MKLSRKLILIDTVVQGGLLALISAGFLPALLLDYDDMVIFSLIGLFILGVWQVLSNIGWMLAGKGQGRAKYLAGVLVFFFLAAILTRFFPFSNNDMTLVLWLGMPYPLAIWSFWLSAVQLSASYSQPRSFWDI